MRHRTEHTRTAGGSQHVDDWWRPIHAPAYPFPGAPSARSAAPLTTPAATSSCRYPSGPSCASSSDLALGWSARTAPRSPSSLSARPRRRRGERRGRSALSLFAGRAVQSRPNFGASQAIFIQAFAWPRQTTAAFDAERGRQLSRRAATSDTDLRREVIALQRLLRKGTLSAAVSRQGFCRDSANSPVGLSRNKRAGCSVAARPHSPLK